MTAKSVTRAEYEEAISQIQDAQEMILEAIQILKGVARDTDDRERHLRMEIARLEIAATSDHQWLDGSSSLDDWIEELREQADESEYDEEGC